MQSVWHYVVTVTVAGGCSGTACKDVTVSSAPSCSISGCTTICAGQNTTLSAPVGCSTYLWNTGATTRTLCVTAAGTYSVTVTNNNGCASSCTTSVTSHSVPSCTITGNNSICSGQSTTLTAPANCTYLWNTGACTRSITVNCAGTYTVCVSNSNGCSSSCSICVSVNNGPTCCITGCNTICVGGNTTLCAPVGCNSYQWNNGANTRTINVTAAGTYTCSVTNSNGCSSSASCCVTVSQAPNCTITGNNSICHGQSTTLTATDLCASYLWNTGATTRSITVSCGGTYTVCVSNNAGCSSSCSRCVTETALPSSCITGNLTFCTGGCTTLSAPAGCSSYLWNNGATTQCITVNCAGNYCVNVTNNNGCSSSSSVCVTETPVTCCVITGCLQVHHGWFTSLCAPAGCNSYSWNTGCNSRNLTVWCPGTYTCTVTNANGCTSTCSVCVTWYCGRVGATATTEEAKDMDSFGSLEATAYPNPFASNATIEFEKQRCWCKYNCWGV